MCQPRALPCATFNFPFRRTKSFEERNQELLKELETANQQLAKLRDECAEHKYEKRALKDQVGAVNLVGTKKKNW